MRQWLGEAADEELELLEDSPLGGGRASESTLRSEALCVSSQAGGGCVVVVAVGVGAADLFVA